MNHSAKWRGRSECFNHAVIVGASIAGLLTARVLSDHFAKVTLIERDALPADASFRAGVPQSRHLHALLPRGLQILEAFFPQLREEMQASGAVLLDTGADIAWLTPQGWGLKVRSGLAGISSSRELLEATIRRRVRQLANVVFCPETEVIGLLRDDSGPILGVHARKREAFTPSSDERIYGDLVVVTSGRQNAIVKWFTDARLEVPQTTVIDAHIGYASRVYRRPQGKEFPWRALILQAAPPHCNRGGLIFSIEGERWQVTLTGGDRAYPPTDEAGFLEYARALRSPELYEALRHAEPDTPIYGYRSTENRRHHLERIVNWPDGLIVVGDAACAFNPIYGQGMSTAAIEAAALSRLLAEDSTRDGLAKTFQREVSRVVRSPWTLATSADLRFESVEGGKAGIGTRLMHRYLDRLLRLGTVDPKARLCFLEVQGMLREASAILRPKMLWRVLTSVAGPAGLESFDSEIHDEVETNSMAHSRPL